MARIGFWEGLFGDVGEVERVAINQNAEALQAAFNIGLDNQTFSATQFQQLFNLDRAQSKELARLRIMVRVLSEAVVELGFDRKTLEDRMEDSLDVLDSEETLARGAYGPGGPFRGGDGSKPTASEPVTTCVVCQKTVLLRCTNIQQQGTVCDHCYHTTLNDSI